jgi:hypothetical protein
VCQRYQTIRLTTHGRHYHHNAVAFGAKTGNLIGYLLYALNTAH